MNTARSVLVAVAAATAIFHLQKPPEAPGTGTNPSTRPAPDQNLYHKEIARAEHLLSLQRYEDAMALLSPLTAAAGCPPRARELRGVALLELHRYDEARNDFETVTKANPSNIPARIGLARALELSGEPEAAAVTLDGALQVEPRRMEAVIGAAQLAMRLGKDEKARVLYVRTLEIEPFGNQAPAAHYALSQIAAREGNEKERLLQKQLYEKKFAFAERKAALERAVVERPKDPKPRRALGNLYREAGDGNTALQWLLPLAAAHPEDVTILLDAAEAHLLARHPDKAAGLCMAAARRDATSSRAHRVRCEMYLQIPDYKKSLESLKAAADLDPTAVRDALLPAAARALQQKARDGGDAATADAVEELLRTLRW